MTPEEIRELAGICIRNGIAEIELDDGNLNLRLRLAHATLSRASRADEMKPEDRSQQPAKTISAPGVGVFLHAHPTTGRSMVEAGQPVSEEQVVGFLRVGDIVKPVISNHDGIVAEVLAEDGTIAGFGTPLYRLD